MRKKIIGISIVMLFLALIPSTSLASKTPEEDKLLFLKGTVKINEIENNTVHAFSIRLLYFQITTIKRWVTGRINLNKVTFPDGFLMIPIGKLTFIIGLVKSPIGINLE